MNPGGKFRLKERQADDTLGVTKSHAIKAMPHHVEKLAALHDLLYAEHKRALLIVLQGMDAAGKDGTIKHVMSGVNPQGCTVTSFKQPSVEELDHDFLWRIHQAVPEKGAIGIFNRSQYEDVLIARVHKLAPREAIEKRYAQINEFEKNPVSERRAHPEIFSAHEQRGAAPAIRRAPRQSGKKLEGVAVRLQGTRILGSNIRRPMKTPLSSAARRNPPGTPSRPITNGFATMPWPKSS